MYGNYVRLRDDRGLSDYRVAKDTGLNATLFSDWKRGKSAPKIDKLMRLAEYFGVTLEELVNGSGTDEG